MSSSSMLCDLNVPFPQEINKSSINQLERVLATLVELKYTHVAINKQLTPAMYQGQNHKGTPKNSKKHSNSNNMGTDNAGGDGYDLKKDIDQFFECFNNLELKFQDSLKLFSRCTVQVDDPSKLGGVFINIASGSSGTTNNKFDIVSVLPLSERGLAYLTSNSKGDVDILTFDYTNYFNGFHLKHKTMMSLVKKGIKVELVYSPMFNNTQQAMKFIGNAKQVIRTCRNGINSVIISSGAISNLQLRNKLGVQTMLKFLGMKSHVCNRMMNENPGLAILSGRLRVKSYQQVITSGSDVVNGGDKSAEYEVNGFIVRKGKRSIEEVDSENEESNINAKISKVTK